MKPTIGRIVIYTLSDEDCKQINRRRTTGKNIADRIALNNWHEGSQAHIGNETKTGQSLPMMIVSVHSDTCVNGQVFLDGNDCFWATSRNIKDAKNINGFWSWPIVEKPAEVIK